MKLSSSGFAHQMPEGEKRCLNSELWHACAGPLISLPPVGSRVVYFPQGHSEQVAASTNKEVDGHIPNYPNLPPQLICQLHDVTMHADAETDEVYAQMTLQPLSPQEQKETYLPAELGGPSKQPTNYFCKTLTASDTSTHGGFSVPRRAAEKVFPPLDFSQQPPAQELIARDLHDNEWKFRHIFRGQPKRHLLTTGWSVFVSAKRLVAGDSVLFIWNENNQLLLGIRRANRPQTVMPSSVLSSDSMHIGLLAAAAHAAATNSRFTIFYNPRASPSEFVIPLAKYAKAVYHTRVSVGMRFRMLFETEESSVRRYMGTITGISDLDPVRWPNSHWRSVKVGWDESTAGERQPRVSLWEIEPLTTFPMYPSLFPLRLKRPWPSGLPSLTGVRDDGMGLNPPFMCLRDNGDWRIPSMNFQGSGTTPWMRPRLDSSLLGMQPDMYQAMAAAALQEIRSVDPSKQISPAILQFQQPNNPGRPVSLLPGEILQQVHSQPQVPFQTIQGNLTQTQSQSSLLPCQLQCKSFNDQQQQVAQQQVSQQENIQQQVAAQQHVQQLPHQHQQELHQQHQQLHQQQYAQDRHQLQLPQQQNQQQHQLSKQHQQNHELPQHLSDNPRPHVVSTLSQLVSSPQSNVPVLPVSPFIQQHNFSDSTNDPATTSVASPLHGILNSFPTEESTHLNLQRPNSMTSSSAWLPKRIGVDSPISFGASCVLPHVDHLGSPQANISQPSVTLSPFTGRECLVDQDGSSDAQNNLLFGVNIDSSSLVAQNGIASLRNVVAGCDSNTIPFAPASLPNTSESEFPLNLAVATSGCLDESRLLHSPENVDRINPQNVTFVKVYKSGSFGRSLDITRFNNYPELRSELGRMFGLEGQLEDPMRSGWQLVFVDRENDILLVGDDPWQEFVNNVWYIKILSPQEVLQMGKQGPDPLDSVPVKQLSNGGCDDYVSRQDTRKLSTGITSVGSLDH